MAPAEQRGYLESQCADDPSLVAETLSLIAEDARGGSLLDHGVASVARDVFKPATYNGASNQTFGPYRITKVLG